MSVFGNYSNYYDSLYKDKDYLAEVDFVDSLIKKYGIGGVKTILDIGCGTGGHAFLLDEDGYDVTGIDISENMLSIAKEKAKKTKAYVDFFKADIRDFDLNKKFDVAISMFAVMGYQTTNEDFENTLRNVNQHLKLGGLFIFDVWFGPAVISQKPGDKIRIIENGGEKIIRLTRSTLDIMKHIVDVNFNVTRIKDSKILEEIEETHRMRFFFPMEMELFLKNNGYQILNMIPFMDIDGVLSEDKWDITVITRKIE